MQNQRTTQHIDDAIDIGMTGNLSAQPRCQCQVCKAAHDLNQNVGEHSTCSHSRSRFLVRSIHTTKTAAVAGGHTEERSEGCATERSAYHTCIEYQCHQGHQPLNGHPLEALTHCQEQMRPAQSCLDWRACVRHITNGILNVVPVRMQLQCLQQHTHNLLHVAPFKKFLVDT